MWAWVLALQSSALGVPSNAFSAPKKHMEGKLSDLCAALNHFQPPIYHHGNLARSAGSLSQVSGQGETDLLLPDFPLPRRGSGFPPTLEDVNEGTDAS